jgi:hypothetical protein
VYVKRAVVGPPLTALKEDLVTLAPNPVYQEHPERRGVSRKTVIEEAKAKVPVIDLADLLCGPQKMRRVGDEWVARCPLPNHEDKTPSFPSPPEEPVVLPRLS